MRLLLSIVLLSILCLFGHKSSFHNLVNIPALTGKTANEGFTSCDMLPAHDSLPLIPGKIAETNQEVRPDNLVTALTPNRFCAELMQLNGYYRKR